MNRRCRLAALLLIASSLSFGGVPNPERREASYEPHEETLRGVIHRLTFPGPPNYEDIGRGDTPEIFWILTLENPIEVAADKHHELNTAETGVRQLQIVFAGGNAERSYVKFQETLGEPVTVRGTLFHAHTAHHRTDVLIVVRDIQAKIAVKKHGNLPR